MKVKGRGEVISVLACTNREDFIENIIRNFEKQTLRDKELVLILNSNEINSKRIEELLKNLQSCYQLLQYPKEVTLGECLNKGAAAASYNYVAKMDDDDYYGPEYLDEAFGTIVQTDSDVVGKSSFYIFFKRNHELRLFNPNREHNWIINNGQNHYKADYFFSGGTLVVKKEVFRQIAFPAVNIGEDSGFQRLCFENQLKMYSLSKDHYAYIRYDRPLHHNSDVSDSILKKRSHFVSHTSLIKSLIISQIKGSD
jgi:glycosyltransferase involved in cell wall biosynthesis